MTFFFGPRLSVFISLGQTSTLNFGAPPRESCDELDNPKGRRYWSCPCLLQDFSPRQAKSCRSPQWTHCECPLCTKTPMCRPLSHSVHSIEPTFKIPRYSRGEGSGTRAGTRWPDPVQTLLVSTPRRGTVGSSLPLRNWSRDQSTPDVVPLRFRG